MNEPPTNPDEPIDPAFGVPLGPYIYRLPEVSSAAVAHYAKSILAARRAARRARRAHERSLIPAPASAGPFHRALDALLARLANIPDGLTEDERDAVRWCFGSLPKAARQVHAELSCGRWQPDAWEFALAPRDFPSDDVIEIKEGNATVWRRSPSARLSWDGVSGNLAFEVHHIEESRTSGDQLRVRDEEEAQRIPPRRPSETEARALLTAAMQLLDTAVRYDRWCQTQPDPLELMHPAANPWLHLIDTWYRLEKGLRSVGFGPHRRIPLTEPASPLFLAIHELAAASFAPPLYPPVTVGSGPGVLDYYPPLTGILPRLRWATDNLDRILDPTGGEVVNDGTGDCYTRAFRVDEWARNLRISYSKLLRLRKKGLLRFEETPKGLRLHADDLKKIGCTASQLAAWM